MDQLDFVAGVETAGVGRLSWRPLSLVKRLEGIIGRARAYIKTFIPSAHTRTKKLASTIAMKPDSTQSIGTLFRLLWKMHLERHRRRRLSARRRKG
jgi:hypothetical protein